MPLRLVMMLCLFLNCKEKGGLRPHLSALSLSTRDVFSTSLACDLLAEDLGQHPLHTDRPVRQYQIEGALELAGIQAGVMRALGRGREGTGRHRIELRDCQFNPGPLALAKPAGRSQTKWWYRRQSDGTTRQPRICSAPRGAHERCNLPAIRHRSGHQTGH